MSDAAKVKVLDELLADLDEAGTSMVGMPGDKFAARVRSRIRVHRSTEGKRRMELKRRNVAGNGPRTF